MGPMALEPNGFSSHHWYWVENWWAPQRTNLLHCPDSTPNKMPCSHISKDEKHVPVVCCFFLRNNMCQAILKTWGEQYVTKTLMTNPTIREANWVTNWSMRCWILASNRTWSYHLVSCDWPKKQLMEWRTWEKTTSMGPPMPRFPLGNCRREVPVNCHVIGINYLLLNCFDPYKVAVIS